MSSQSVPVIAGALTRQGAGTRVRAVTDDPAMVSPASAAEAALALRDEALAALDAGDRRAALARARRGLTVLGAAGLRGGPDEAAVLIALAQSQTLAVLSAHSSGGWPPS